MGYLLCRLFILLYIVIILKLKTCQGNLADKKNEIISDKVLKACVFTFWIARNNVVAQGIHYAMESIEKRHDRCTEGEDEVSNAGTTYTTYTTK